MTATKKMVVVKGKGTNKETRTTTSVALYPVRTRSGRLVYVSIPD